MQLFHSPAIFQRFSNLIAAESKRQGGVSFAPFASLNLGINTADAPENVQENRRRFFEKLGVPEHSLASSLQVHGEAIRIVTQPERTEGFDAFITEVPGVVLGVTVADCTPVLLYDARRRVVGAVHAGWRGTVLQLVYKTLDAMHWEYGTEPGDCYAYVGTCIDECAFEVGEEVADRFSEKYKRYDAVVGKFMVDLKRANEDQLKAFGIPSAHIEISPFSTVTHNADYFSYRLEKGQTGRMLAVIGLKNE
ncbi:peptidoglycan editing factor PgeF [Runella slithyformis]|uniref:Purine nucleoside phosphorylase n=1 Tax=Runella slithyformis (strain ATCC 29530 / DSM 19594 / LMG 11500 / NCIMB 11436 / LSU 4) TaxID=761193 RepID=A0A7U3ZQK0_RUNSL|nr:peptidoglycan editing factor PgeF [Runella slithyformis]AEI51537.1 Multi-copper polyphenol oxidoreductase, laccase [Runella slithyformis DSM 19594]